MIRPFHCTRRQVREQNKPSTETVLKRPKFSELERIEACVEGESTHTY